MKRQCFIFVLILIVNFCLSGLAFATEENNRWLKVVGNDKVITYLDTKSVSKHNNNNLVSCWIKITPTEEYKNNFSQDIINTIPKLNNTKPSYILEYVKFDIQNVKYKIFEEVIYSDSKEIEKVTINDSWESVIPEVEPMDSVFQSIKKYY
ncbi:MAG: hypothetical protein H6Q72_1415 [Firmicutes bacterium]|nr:hypothetical protein [Bacillota bacterium]